MVRFNINISFYFELNINNVIQLYILYTYTYGYIRPAIPLNTRTYDIEPSSFFS